MRLMPRMTSTLIGGRYALGQYRDRVTIQTRLVPDGDDWIDVAPDVWARVAPLRAWERLQAAQLQASVDYRVAIPACPRTLDASMRLVWTTSPRGTSVVLNIQAVIPDVTETICDCVEAHT